MGTLGRMPPFLTFIQQRTATRVQTNTRDPGCPTLPMGGGNEGPPPITGNLRIGKTAPSSNSRGKGDPLLSFRAMELRQ